MHCNVSCGNVEKKGTGLAGRFTLSFQKINNLGESDNGNCGDFSGEETSNFSGNAWGFTRKDRWETRLGAPLPIE